jgi:hypothetical protein
MTFFVKRTTAAGRTAWTGSFRTETGANRERDAWLDAGRAAEVVTSTAEVRQQVREWERDVKRRRASLT